MHVHIYIYIHIYMCFLSIVYLYVYSCRYLLDSPALSLSLSASPSLQYGVCLLLRNLIEVTIIGICIHIWWFLQVRGFQFVCFYDKSPAMWGCIRASHFWKLPKVNMSKHVCVYIYTPNTGFLNT